MNLSEFTWEFVVTPRKARNLCDSLHGGSAILYLCAFSAIFGQLAPPEGQGIPPVEGDPRNRVDRWLTTRRKFGKGPFGRFLDEGIKTEQSLLTAMAYQMEVLLDDSSMRGLRLPLEVQRVKPLILSFWTIPR